MSWIRGKSFRDVDPALLVILAGVCAALHVGKLSPALPVLREALGVTLLQAGFLLSLVQFAGMTLGLAVGLAADGLGLKRSMVAGLLVLFVASSLGGLAPDANTLLILRGVEGFGFLLVSMPAPSLIRHLVQPHRISAMLGMWGAYMPLGTALALLCGPLVITSSSWQVWWWGLAGLTLLMAGWLWLLVPPDAVGTSGNGFAVPRAEDSWTQRLYKTLTSRGPWLVALSFAVYSGQWLAVIGFLPTIYTQAGFAGGITAVMTALVAAVNMIGNIASGRLLARGVAPQRLLYTGFAVMGLGAVIAFANLGPSEDPILRPLLRFIAILFFSMVGGVIPGTLYSLAVRLAPNERTISTTVGWMQQWAAIGQFAGPPAVAWVAGAAGNWQWTWLVTGGCALTGLALAVRIQPLLAAQDR
jgi:MFS transporter, CP family, cyanate transporter